MTSPENQELGVADGERRERKMRARMQFEQAIIAAIVTIIISFVCVAARAQEAKPCPSDKICPVCIEQDGLRSCKVEGPGQPKLPQATAPLDISAKRHCVTTTGGSGVHYRCCQQAASCYGAGDQGKPSAAANTAAAPRCIPRHGGDRRQCGRTKFDLHL